MTTETKSRRLFVRCRLITTPAEPGGWFEDGALAAEEGVVKAAGNRMEVVRRCGIDPAALDALLERGGGDELRDGTGRAWRIIDCRGRLLMPGFVNVHGHFYGYPARGIDIPLESSRSFVEVLRNLWWLLDRNLRPETVRLAASVGILENLRNGTTTMVDHHASPNAIEGSTELIAEQARRLRMRVCLCYEVSDRDGEKAAAAGVEENLRLLDRWPPGRDPFVSSLFGIHAPFTVGDDTLRRIADALEKAPHPSGIHVHCCESESDNAICIEKYGKGAVERLHDAGLLNEYALLAHLVHATPRQLELVASSGARAVHNPLSNMNNGVGICDVPAMLEAGITVGLGSDGFSSCILEEHLACGLLQRLRTGNPSVGWELGSRLLFENNPAICANLFPEPVGTLTEGSAADIVEFDYLQPSPLHGGNLEGHLLFGVRRAPVKRVFVAAEQVIEDGRHVAVDEEALYEEASREFSALWKRMQSDMG